MSPETTQRAEAVGLLLHRAERAAARHVENALAGRATMEQWRVLDLLSDGAGRPMSEIAGHAQVPAPTLTKIVDRLVDAALVHRRVDDGDRRRILVFLSEHGRERHAGLAPAVADAERRIADALGPDAAGLRELLGRLTAGLG